MKWGHVLEVYIAYKYRLLLKYRRHSNPTLGSQGHLFRGTNIHLRTRWPQQLRNQRMEGERLCIGKQFTLNPTGEQGHWDLSDCGNFITTGSQQAFLAHVKQEAVWCKRNRDLLADARLAILGPMSNHHTQWWKGTSSPLRALGFIKVQGTGKKINLGKW